jgi:hypothetical protein
MEYVLGVWSTSMSTVKVLKPPGQIYFKKKIITKNVKIWWGLLKNLLKNYWARKAQIYMKAT